MFVNVRFDDYARYAVCVVGTGGASRTPRQTRQGFYVH